MKRQNNAKHFIPTAVARELGRDVKRSVYRSKISQQHSCGGSRGLVRVREITV